MKQAVLVIIKPEVINKGLAGEVINRFLQTDLEMVALHLVKPTRTLAEQHYKHIKGTPFFEGTIKYFLGKFHKQKKLVAIIFYGNKSIEKCRKVAGATNPEEADPMSLRGAYGRITAKGIFENVVHVSSNDKEAEREIKLWFNPDEITANLYPTKIIKSKMRVWA